MILGQLRMGAPQAKNAPLPHSITVTHFTEALGAINATYELLCLRRPRRSRPGSTSRASSGCPRGPGELDHQACKNKPGTPIGFHIRGNDSKLARR